MQKSVFGKFWRSIRIEEDMVTNISRELQISDFLARLVSTRSSSLQEAFDFLNPKIKTLLPDPFHLLDMPQGVERIIKAIKSKEKIFIFADYDVDGATSSALLKNVLLELGIDTEIYVPDRIEEGYGPTSSAMQKIKDKGTKLLITVDCGSVAFEALLHASEIGLDVIVIDHHISLDKLPKAIAVINPNRIDETSDHKNLAAVGVAFLFAVAFCSTLKKEGFFENSAVKYPDLMRQLDIVALGTVCDVMTLTGLNRAFVKQGLKVAKNRTNIGYATLCDVAELQEAINCYHLGFVLGPRINAGGRVGTSSLGATLLSTKSSKKARELSEELSLHNDNRKLIELTILEEAHKAAKLQAKNAVIFVSGKGWHPGVIGIVAGRLKESYNRPVAVIAINDSIGKGSCRSIKGCDFGSALMEANLNDILIAGGGHAMAAGFTIEESKLFVLQEFLENRFEAILKNSTAHLEEFYNLDLMSSAVNDDLIEEINRLEPFGNGNPSPVFKFNNLFVLKADIVGGNHIKVLFAPARDSHASKPLNAIAFNSVNTVLADVILSQKPYDLSVIGNLKVNNWQNRQTIQLQIKDLIIQP
ncbi:MAG: single-stranded-DNA-specific exonuclease RecJ [Rickettsiaceae bacterium]